MARRAPPNIARGGVGNDSHPYAFLSPSAVPVVSSHDSDSEDECPVCLEPLSFSFRLPGEKPHIVPECGHALHQACFAAVYGPLPPRNAATVGRKTNLGVCGVCRRAMRVAEGDQSGGKSNKLAALTGMTDRLGVGGSNSLYPGRETPVPVGERELGTNPNIDSRGIRIPGSVNPMPNAPTSVIKRSPRDDDPLDKIGSSIKSGSHDHSHHSHQYGNSTSSTSTYIVTPSIQARAEFPTITRQTPSSYLNGDVGSVHGSVNGSGTTQPLTCIVVVELPARRNFTQQLPGPVMDGYHRPPSYAAAITPSSGQNKPRLLSPNQNQLPHNNSDLTVVGNSNLNGTTNGKAGISGQRSRSPSSASVTSNTAQSQSHSHAHSYSTSSDPDPSTSQTSPYTYGQDDSNSPFRAITDDLRARIIDWKGHSLAGLGPLCLYDHLHVRRDQLLREFFVYLFSEAIICVIEEKKRSFARLLPEGSSYGGGNGASPSGKGVLRLKGRIFVKHIRNVTDTSVLGELSLTIDMEDEKLDSFILIFKERSSLETWRKRIMELVVGERVRRNVAKGGLLTEASKSNSWDEEESPPNLTGKAARMLSGTNTTGTARSSSRTVSSSVSAVADSLFGAGGRNTISSTTSVSSYGGGYANHSIAKHAGTMGMIEEDSGYAEGEVAGDNDAILGSPPGSGSVSTGYPSPPPHSHQHSSLVAPHITHGPSNNLPVLPHTPMDVLLILSVPSPRAPRSTARLKLRVLRTTLDFVIASLGPNDRLSIVTFEIGIGGRVRKTPFLRLGGNGDGAVRLARFVERIGRALDDDGQEVNGNGEDSSEHHSVEDDEFMVNTGKDEKTDVVTAVNHGLDVVLQRKQRNPISSILLVSDAADSARRAQMDLVLARAEAANIAIHSFGYGRSHDPASLWLMSNHTSGTYTFVKEWYDLRDCIAGCLGGMMSVALLNAKLHIKVLDGNRFKIRKVSGVGNSIVSSDGRDVDVELGELRYGERKEMLVEVDLDNSDDLQRMAAQGSFGQNGRAANRRTLNGTDQFMQRLGLDALTLSDPSDLMDGMMERMIDEVPVFELDGSYYDPAAGKNVSRLAHPVLLTVTLLPPAGSRPKTPNGPSDPVIVRRRMELFASDMITRALVLVSKKNYPQAQKVLFDTRRILNTALQNITQGLPPPSGQGNTVRNRKEILVLQAVRTLQSIQQDIQVLSEALDENIDGFAYDQRNFGAQQAMILRDQKCWSGRTATERLFFSVDNAIELVSRSTDWVTTRD